MKYSLCIIFALLVVGCGNNPGAAFDRLGVTEHSIATGRIFDQKGQAEWRSLSTGDIRMILSEMKRIRPARTAVVEPRYRIELFTEEFAESPHLEIFIDETGEGYFRREPGREIVFFSKAALSAMATLARDPEQSTGGNAF